MAYDSDGLFSLGLRGGAHLELQTLFEADWNSHPKGNWSGTGRLSDLILLA